MRLVNKTTGEVESMTFGPAMQAINLGTHDVYLMSEADETGLYEDSEAPVADAEAEATDAPEEDPAEEPAAESLDAMTKAELLDEAERRGVEVSSSMRKAEILQAIKDAV